MKVKRKAPEATAMEKRNTAILYFIGAALVPLLLMLFLGFSLDKGDVVNRENLFVKFTDLKDEHKALQGDIVKLDSTFSYADQLLKQLNNDVKEHIKQLSNIESSITMTPWKKDKEAIIENFKYGVEKIERNYDWDENSPMNVSLAFGKKWLKEFAQAKKDEFSAMELIREKELTYEESQTSSDGTDLQTQVQAFQMQLLQKDFEIGNLQRDLNDCVNDAGEDKSALSGQLSSYQEKTITAKMDISTQVSELRTLLEDLEGQRFGKLKNDKGKVNKLKNQLNDRLNKIDLILSGLN